MSIGFSDPLVGGKGNLVRPYFQSPNFVANTSGWQITRSGSAQFNNLTVTGGEQIQGLDLFYSSTPPALGTLVMSIAPNAGIDTYGNAYPSGVTVFDTFGDFIQETFGVNVGWNLSLEGLGTEGYINISSAGSGNAMQGMINFAVPTGSVNGPPLLTLVSESQDGSKTGYILLDNSDEIRCSPQSTVTVKFTFTTDGTHIYEYAAVTANGLQTIGSNNALLPGSTTLAPETWHSFSTLLNATLWTTSGATNPARYRMEPQGTGLCVRFDGYIITTGIGPWPANVTLASLPTPYHPAFGHPFVSRSDIAVAAGQDTVNVLTGGGIQNGQVFAAAGQRLFFDGITFPLD
jgi:hypothetical protein